MLTSFAASREEGSMRTWVPHLGRWAWTSQAEASAISARLLTYSLNPLCPSFNPRYSFLTSSSSSSSSEFTPLLLFMTLLLITPPSPFLCFLSSWWCLYNITLKFSIIWLFFFLFLSFHRISWTIGSRGEVAPNDSCSRPSSSSSLTKGLTTSSCSRPRSHFINL